MGRIGATIHEVNNAQSVANYSCTDSPLKWVAVQLAATATARTSLTPNHGTIAVFLIPRYLRTSCHTHLVSLFLDRSVFSIWDANVPLLTSSRFVAISFPTSTSNSLRKRWKLLVFVPTSMSPRRLERILSTCVSVSTPSMS